MKKQLSHQKLNLRRETVRVLQRELANAAGGAAKLQSGPGCSTSILFTCHPTDGSLIEACVAHDAMQPGRPRRN